MFNTGSSRERHAIPVWVLVTLVLFAITMACLTVARSTHLLSTILPEPIAFVASVVVIVSLSDRINAYMCLQWPRRNRRESTFVGCMALNISAATVMVVGVIIYVVSFVFIPMFI